MGTSLGAEGNFDSPVGVIVDTRGKNKKLCPPNNTNACPTPNGSKPWKFYSGCYASQVEPNRAVANGAQQAAAKQEQNSPPASRSTQVQSNVGQPGSSIVTNVFTVGGIQILKTKNGAIDLRWHQNQQCSSSPFKRNSFLPAGEGAWFGFLHDIIGYSGDAQQRVTVNSGSGGFSRAWVSSAGVPVDPRDINSYNFSAPTYYVFDT